MEPLSLLKDPTQIQHCHTPDHSRVRMPGAVTALVDWYGRQQGINRPVASNRLMLIGLQTVLNENPGAMDSLLRNLDAKALQDSAPVVKLASPSVVSIFRGTGRATGTPPKGAA
jgi:predicted GNAT superfamily acetyltransferase